MDVSWKERSTVELEILALKKAVVENVSVRAKSRALG